MSERKATLPDIFDPMEQACALGMDAMRISLGQPTKNYEPELVARWIAFRARPLPDEVRE
jgi:hypothetical protein